MFGFVGSLVALAGGIASSWSTIDQNDDYAILIAAAAGILLYLGSIVVLPLIALVIELADRSPKGQMGRALLTFLGAFLPGCLVFLGIFGIQLILGG